MRNQTVALIFATIWFHIINLPAMRRDVFQAIADPTRRAIIGLLATEAKTPNDLAGHFHTTRQAISKHLRILAECELLQQRQQGREIYYLLDAPKMKTIDDWLQQYRQLWENRFAGLDLLLNPKNPHKP